MSDRTLRQSVIREFGYKILIKLVPADLLYPKLTVVFRKNEGRLLPGHSETDADKLSSSSGQNEHKNSLLIQPPWPIPRKLW